jgi:hypothetical protein
MEKMPDDFARAWLEVNPDRLAAYVANRAPHVCNDGRTHLIKIGQVCGICGAGPIVDRIGDKPGQSNDQ